MHKDVEEQMAIAVGKAFKNIIELAGNPFFDSESLYKVAFEIAFSTAITILGGIKNKKKAVQILEEITRGAINSLQANADEDEGSIKIFMGED
jgi:hypothetical protein